MTSENKTFHYGDFTCGQLRLQLARHPQKPEWELVTVPQDARVYALGWRETPHPVDALIPAPVTHLLIHALCSIYRLTYFGGKARSHSWVRAGEPNDDQNSWITGIRMPFSLLPFRWPKTISLISTTNPSRAVELFDMGYFSWDMQQQWVFLTDRDNPPPTIQSSHLKNVLNDGPIGKNSLSDGSPLLGFMAPGVDGILAQLVIFDHTFWSKLYDRMQQTSTDLDLEIEEVDEFTLWE